MRSLLITLFLFSSSLGFAQEQEDVIAYTYVGCVIERYCVSESITTLDKEILNLKTALESATGLNCEVLGVGQDVEADKGVALEVAGAIVTEGEATCLSTVD